MSSTASEHHGPDAAMPVTSAGAAQRLFTEAVMDWHRPVHFPHLGTTVCACGHRIEDCRYQLLARQLGLIR